MGGNKGSAVLVVILIFAILSLIIIGGSLFIKNQSSGALSQLTGQKVQPTATYNHQVDASVSASNSASVTKSQGNVVSYHKLSLSLPRGENITSTKETNNSPQSQTMTVNYGDNDLISITYLSPEILFHLADLNLSGDVLKAKYESVAAADINVSQKIITELGGNYDPSLTADSNPTGLRYVKKMIAAFNLPDYTETLIKTDNPIIVYMHDSAGKTKILLMGDSDQALYRIVVKDDDQAINLIVPTVQVN